MRLEITALSARLDRPFETAGGAIAERELLLVRLEAQDGAVGWGESAPLQHTGGEVRDALEAYRPALAAAGGSSRAQILAQCARAASAPPALAAIDLALWDLEGHRAGQPVWQLLGAAGAWPVTVNATIAAADRATASAEAAAARDAGFGTVKVKVGLGDDAGRVAAVRAAGGAELGIRLDANGAWTVAEARSALRALEPAGIELCEEPVHGLEATAELAADCPVPIAIDESVAEPGALERRVCDAVCLKIAARGGITNLIADARAARAAGYQVYLASSLDGPLGIAAALHAAAVLEPDRPCGLATLGLFAGRTDPLAPRTGAITPPSSPGLGEELLAWYG